MGAKLAILPKKGNGSIGLIGHVVANYPSKELVLGAVEAMASEGVELLEIQIPFSEPTADGPLFVKANHEALLAGVSVQDCWDLTREVTSQFPNLVVVMMSYANVIYRLGESFFTTAKEVGAKGLIVPDWPLDQAADLLQQAAANDIAVVPVISPNISDQRLAMVLEAGSGFVYLTARAGVTGVGDSLDSRLTGLVQAIREQSDLPVAIGFGIHKKSQVQQLRELADYAIVGSAAFRALEQNGVEGVRKFWASLR